MTLIQSSQIDNLQLESFSNTIVRLCDNFVFDKTAHDDRDKSWIISVTAVEVSIGIFTSLSYEYKALGFLQPNCEKLLCL